jgi:hypothetical protein
MQKIIRFHGAAITVHDTGEIYRNGERLPEKIATWSGKRLKYVVIAGKKSFVHKIVSTAFNFGSNKTTYFVDGDTLNCRADNLRTGRAGSAVVIGNQVYASPDEVARVLRIPASTVYSALWRGSDLFNFPLRWHSEGRKRRQPYSPSDGRRPIEQKIAQNDQKMDLKPSFELEKVEVEPKKPVELEVFFE